MTKQQMIYMIVGAVISSFSNVIFDKILGPYIPDKKKLSSYIRFFFFFILRYALPICEVIYLMVRFDIINKFFILSMCVAFSTLILNINIDVLIWIKKQVSKSYDIAERLNDKLSKLVTEMHDTVLVALDKMNEVKKKLKKINRKE